MHIPDSRFYMKRSILNYAFKCDRAIVILFFVRIFNKLVQLINYLITESEVVTGKSQSEALPY